MRKVFVVLSVVFLLGICVVPAFATSNAPNEQVYSPLYIEGISNSATSESYAFPYNVLKKNVLQTEFSFGQGLLGDYIHLAQGDIYGTFYMPEFADYSDGFTVTLFAKAPQVINEIDINSWEIGLPNANRFVRCTVEFSLWEPAEVGTEYQMKSTRKETVVDIEWTRVRVGNYMATLIPDNYDYALISDLVIKIQFLTNSDPIGQMAIGFQDRVAPATFTDYIRERHLIAKEYEEFPGLFDWLLDSAQSFLDLRIGPDVSINDILGVTVVVAVLFWFITLLI